MQHRSNISKLTLSPLTEENLSKINNESSPYIYDNEMISRYCLNSSSNVSSPNSRHEHKVTPSPSTSHRSRTISMTRDIVVESPRLSPFPYHNDSLFLPTVEKKQHAYNKRKNGSISSISVYSQKTMNSTTTESLNGLPRRAVSAPPKYVRPKPHLYSNKTSSSLRDEISFNQNQSSLLSRFLHIFKKKKKPSSSESSSSESTTSPNPTPSSSTTSLASNATTIKTTASMNHYHHRHIPQSPSRASTKAPVWFSQYTLNPPAPNRTIMTAA
ncbi:unnamed protein product [Cunninghamella blakesleeana]